MKLADSGLGVVIYIIAFIIAIISSIAKKRAKEQEVHHPEPQKKPVKTWEDILAETLDIPKTYQAPKETREPTLQPASVPSKPEINKTVQKSNEIKTKSTFVRTGLKDTHVYKPIDFKDGTYMPQENAFQQESYAKVDLDFDIKKAIIFSEILNKKYF